MPSAASSMPNLVGHVLNNRYELVRVLGSGSFGLVYRAIDLKAPSDTCDRAIKLVSKAGRKSHSLASLRREMALHMRASKHPNVITLHDAYEDGNYFVFVMDYCRGGDLSDYLAEHGAYDDEKKLRKVFVALLDAIDFLHKQRIYHRDLKPHNILVSEDGSEVFIADFGLSSENNMYEHSCGTPAYMPPECIGDDYRRTGRGDRTDVWALGLILLNLLSGHTPWLRATRENDIYSEFVEDADFLLECLPITIGTNKLVRRMLRANPLARARLSDVRRMVSELDSFYIIEKERLAERDVAGKRVSVDVGGMRSTLAAEIEIQNLDWAPNTRARQIMRGEDCSGGSMVSSSPSCGSSARSTPMVLTPEDSVVGVNNENEKKDFGDRLRSLISRLTRRPSSS